MAHRQFLVDILLGKTPVKLTTDAGSPEGSVTANAGSLYFNTSGGAAATLFVKTSGSGNTNWKGVLTTGASINDLSDVAISSATEGDVLTYNSGNWVNQAPTVYAPTNATFVTLSNNGSLSAERVLTGSSSINIADAGANSTVTLSVIASGVDHGSLSGLGDDDHTQYITTSPANGTRNVITGATDADALTIKTGPSDPELALGSEGLKVTKSDNTSIFSVGVSSTGTSYVNVDTSLWINQASLIYFADTPNEIASGTGYIQCNFNLGRNSGYLNLSSSASADGGYIDTSGSGSNAGGNIKTSGGGGSIDTTGTGSIQLGASATRTTILGAAASAWTLTLPTGAGSANQVLSTNGSGTTSWISHNSIDGLTTGDPHTQYVTISSATLTRNIITSSNAANGALRVKQGSGGVAASTILFSVQDSSSNELISIYTTDTSYTPRSAFRTIPLTLDNNNEVRFQELAANGNHYIKLISPSSLSSNFTHTLAEVTGTSVVASTTSTTSTHAYFSDGTAGGATCRAIASGDLPTSVVLTSGNQTIQGEKTFHDLRTSDATNIKLFEAGEFGTDYVTFGVSALLDYPSGLVFYLPNSNGTNGYFLQTNGAGQTSWASAVTGAGGSSTHVQYNNSGSFAGEADFTWDATNNVLNIGSSTATTKGNLTSNSGSTTRPNILLTGTSADSSADTAGGIALYMTHNESGNRQLVIGASDNVGSSTLSVFRYLTGTGIATIDAVTGDGGNRRPINLGSSTSDVAVGNEGLATNATLSAKMRVYQEAGKVGFWVAAASSGSSDLQRWTNNSGTSLGLVNYSGDFTISPAARTTGSPTHLTITGAAHTTLTAGAEACDVYINLNRTVQFTLGSTIANQRAVYITAPTYDANDKKQTITNAATLAISGAPSQGDSLEIINSYAFLVEAGVSSFSGDIYLQNQKGVRFYEGTGGGSNYVYLSAPATLAGNTPYTLPNAYPASNGYVLSSTTAGVMSWVAPGSGSPGGSNTHVQYNNAGAFGGSAIFTFDGATVTINNIISSENQFICHSDDVGDNFFTVGYDNGQGRGAIRAVNGADIHLGNSSRILSYYAGGALGEFFTIWGDDVTYLGNYSDAASGLNGCTMQIRYGRGNGSGNAIILTGSSQTWEATLGHTFIAPTSSTKPLVVRGAASQSVSLQEWQNSGSIALMTLSQNGDLTLAPVVRTTGSPTLLTVTGPAHTTLTASTEATDINFNLARTVQFAAGALTTQRAMRIQAPTYSFVAASVLTTASTLAISGAPSAGSNATITNAYALNVESGVSSFGGAIYLQNQSALRWYEGSGGGSNYISFAAPATLAGDTPYTLPTGYPAADGYVLSCTTGGVMSWASAGGGSPAFSSITSGTNTTAAMVIGNGASLEVDSTGGYVTFERIGGATPNWTSQWKGSGTGLTGIESGNSSSTNYLVKLPAASATLGIMNGQNSLAQITANGTLDISFSENFFKVDSDAAGRRIQGITDGYAGRRIYIYNAGGWDIVIRHEDTSATAANRIQTPLGVDFVLRPRDEYTFIYNDDTDRWILVGGYDSFLDDRSYCTELWDDFYAGFSNTTASTGNMGNTGFISSSSGANSALSSAPTATNTGEQGWVQCVTGTASGAAVHGGMATGLYTNLLGGTIAECLVRLPVLSDGTNTYVFLFGAGDFAINAAFNATPNNYIGFVYSSASSGNWRYRTRSAGGATNEADTSTAVAVQANTWTHLKWVLNSDRTQVDFWINGRNVGSTTTSIPASNVALRPIFVAINKTAGTTSRTADIDMVSYRCVQNQKRLVTAANYGAETKNAGAVPYPGSNDPSQGGIA